MTPRRRLDLPLSRRRLLALATATAAVAALRRPLAAQAPVLRREVLPNGLVVIVEERPSAETVALQVTARAGSRDDGALPGSSLLTLRMINQGTARWPSESAVQRAVAAVGGMLSRGTTAEYSFFTTTLPADEVDLGFELLADLMADPLFDRDVLERQKLLLLLDQMQRRANPDQLAADLFLETMFAGSPLGTPIQGTPAAVQAMTREAVVDFFRRAWNPSNLVLTIVGRIDPDEALAKARHFFGDLPAGGPLAREPLPAAGAAVPRTVRAEAGQAQTLFRLGFPAPSLRDGDRYAMAVLNAIMGGQSGRLFNEVRNERGLAYVADSVYLPYSDAGAWFATAGVEPVNLDAAVDVVRAEIQRLTEEPVDSAEVASRVTQLSGRRILQSEGNAARAGQLARQEVVGEDPVEQFIRRLGEVTPADVQRVAQSYLHPERAVLIVVGPGGL